MPQEDRPTEVPALEVEPYRRFSLRTLLIATTVFAFVAAAAGVHFRTVDPKAQPFLLTFWASTCFLLPLFVLWNERKRSRSIAKLGRLRYVLPKEHGIMNIYFRPGTNLLRRCALGILFVGLMLFMYTNIASHSHLSRPLWIAASYGFGAAAIIANSFGSDAVSGRRVLLGEFGIVLDARFIPWSEVAIVETDEKTPGRRCIPATRAPDVVFHIPEDQIAKVDAFIADRLSQGHKEPPK